MPVTIVLSEDWAKQADELEADYLRKKLVMFSGYLVSNNQPPAGTPCTICDTIDDTVRKRRLNTAYADDEDNWLVSCAACYNMAVESYQLAWEEYYHSVR